MSSYAIKLKWCMEMVVFYEAANRGRGAAAVCEGGGGV